MYYKSGRLGGNAGSNKDAAEGVGERMGEGFEQMGLSVGGATPVIMWERSKGW